MLSKENRECLFSVRISGRRNAYSCFLLIVVEIEMQKPLSVEKMSDSRPLFIVLHLV